VSRCEGDCTDFKKIAEILPYPVFTDEEPVLEFNQDYTYSITAHYPVAGQSELATIKGNIGELECWNHGTEDFCVNDFYYDQFKDYLETYGYGRYTASEFRDKYNEVTGFEFATKFKKSWQCTDQNILAAASSEVNCGSGQFCVSDESGPKCVQQEACNVGFDPFGLLGTAQTCEQGINYRYCFFDRSTTTINKCYNCNPKMSCYDYKTQGSCERDNCRAGDCGWNPVFDDLGIGVCVDKRYNNCKLCDKKGTEGLTNLDAVMGQV